jgi:hypothetical protein
MAATKEDQVKIATVTRITVLLTGSLMFTSTGVANAADSPAGPPQAGSSLGAPDARAPMPGRGTGIRPNALGEHEVISSIGPNGVPDASDRVVDVAAWSKTPKGRVHMWDYRVTGDVRNQRWHFYVTDFANTYIIQNEFSEMCLDESLDGGSFDGQIVYQYPCNGTYNQLWGVIGGGAGGGSRLYSLQDGRCLDIRNFVDANDATVQVWSCNSSGWNQSWYMTVG